MICRAAAGASAESRPSPPPAETAPAAGPPTANAAGDCGDDYRGVAPADGAARSLSDRRSKASLVGTNIVQLPFDSGCAQSCTWVLTLNGCTQVAWKWQGLAAQELRGYCGSEVAWRIDIDDDSDGIYDDNWLKHTLKCKCP